MHALQECAPSLLKIHKSLQEIQKKSQDALDKSESNVTILEDLNNILTSLHKDIENLKLDENLNAQRNKEQFESMVVQLSNDIKINEKKSEVLIQEQDIKLSQDSLNMFTELISKLEGFKNYLMNSLYISEQRIIEQMQSAKQEKSKILISSDSNIIESYEKKMEKFIESHIKSQIYEKAKQERFNNNLKQYQIEIEISKISSIRKGALNQENKSKYKDAFEERFERIDKEFIEKVKSFLKNIEKIEELRQEIRVNSSTEEKNLTIIEELNSLIRSTIGDYKEFKDNFECYFKNLDEIIKEFSKNPVISEATKLHLKTVQRFKEKFNDLVSLIKIKLGSKSNLETDEMKNLENNFEAPQNNAYAQSSSPKIVNSLI